MNQRFDLHRALQIPRSREVDRILAALFVPGAPAAAGEVVSLRGAGPRSRRDRPTLAADADAASRITGGASP